MEKIWSLRADEEIQACQAESRNVSNIEKFLDIWFGPQDTIICNNEVGENYKKHTITRIEIWKKDIRRWMCTKKSDGLQHGVYSFEGIKEVVRNKLDVQAALQGVWFPVALSLKMLSRYFRELGDNMDVENNGASNMLITEREKYQLKHCPSAYPELNFEPSIEVMIDCGY